MTTDGPRDADLPRTPEEMQAFLDGLRFTEAPVEPHRGWTRHRWSCAPFDCPSTSRHGHERSPPNVAYRSQLSCASGSNRGYGRGDRHTRDAPVAELGKRLAEANRAYQVIVNRRAHVIDKPPLATAGGQR